ncbi:hypothetical protein FA95DRAFT_1555490 [Auriscalpium vulgare]|uniref:Uncharacterized protein n=1 Tax=Auriscalpium vulgare TaxID=40419 RepID=A0ACB8S285_9AGAM|nr:hypothetical protein FA95DRAFT_1555490 [Auriscalpium vulgare]
MPTRVPSKGKKRAAVDVDKTLEDAEEPVASTSRAGTSSPPPEARPLKKQKRAETRQCPVCAEHIPIRLLSQHQELETQRVHAVLARVGDLDPFIDPYASAGATSSARRRSAIYSPSSAASSDRLVKTIGAFKKRRKQRNQSLRDVTRDEDELPLHKGKGKARAGQTCPICVQEVFGDLDVVNAHVDSCIAHAALQEATNVSPPPDADPNADIDVDGDADGFADADADPWEEITASDGVARLRLRSGPSSAQRLGFTVRQSGSADVEEEVDVDGDDVEVFGAVQFTDADVLSPSWEVPMASANPPLVVPEGGMGCRICLDAYAEPTVSTGCWHTFCRNCWLQCLGSTGLCPICKRITAATELRRIYL